MINLHYPSRTYPIYHQFSLLHTPPPHVHHVPIFLNPRSVFPPSKPPWLHPNPSNSKQPDLRAPGSSNEHYSVKSKTVAGTSGSYNSGTNTVALSLTFEQSNETSKLIKQNQNQVINNVGVVSDRVEGIASNHKKENELPNNCKPFDANELTEQVTNHSDGEQNLLHDKIDLEIDVQNNDELYKAKDRIKDLNREKEYDEQSYGDTEDFEDIYKDNFSDKVDKNEGYEGAPDKPQIVAPLYNSPLPSFLQNLQAQKDNMKDGLPPPKDFVLLENNDKSPIQQAVVTLNEVLSSFQQDSKEKHMLEAGKKTPVPTISSHPVISPIKLFLAQPGVVNIKQAVETDHTSNQTDFPSFHSKLSLIPPGQNQLERPLSHTEPAFFKEPQHSNQDYWYW